MGLETATYIAGLITTNPLAVDPKSQGDDHLRLIKSALQATFPGLTGIALGVGTEAQGGTVNDFVVTLSPVPTSLHDRMVVLTKAAHTNIAGACTFGIGSIAALPLKGARGTSLMAGDLTNGDVFGVIYDAGSTSWYLITPNDRVSRNGDTIASLTVVGALAAGATALASLAVTGAATGTTPTAGDNSTNLATTAFVVAAVLGASATIPGQTDHGGLALVTDGVSANWGIGPAAQALMALGVV